MDQLPGRTLWRLFHQTMLRDLLRSPGRSLLTVAGIALGVGVVVAVEAANQQAVRSLSRGLRDLSGRAQLHISGGGLAVQEGLLRDLSWVWDYGALAPFLEGRAKLPGGEMVRVVGVDLLIDQGLRSYLTVSGELFPDLDREDFLDLITNPSTLIVPLPLARHLGVSKGSPLRLRLGAREVVMEVGALLAAQGVGGAFGGHFLLLDLAAAQELFRRPGELDRIDVWVADEASVPLVEGRLRQQLPPTLQLLRAPQLGEQREKMLRAFRYNLNALSCIALLVGMLLVYNTLNLSVVRRRTEIAILRSLGTGRGTLLVLYLGQAALLGLTGSLLGLGVGKGLSWTAQHLVAGTVEVLYTGLSTPPGGKLPPAEQLLAMVCLGTALSLFSGVFPALRASRLSPVSVLRPGSLLLEVQRWRGRRLAAGLAFLLLGLAASSLPAVQGIPLFGYLSALLWVIAFGLLTVPLLSASTSFLRLCCRRLGWRQGELCVQMVQGGIPRVAVAVLSLTVATGMVVSVGTMVGSFRDTLQLWVEQTLRADLYVRGGGAAPNDWENVLPEELYERIRELPSVLAVDRFRAREIIVSQRPVLLGAADFEVLRRFGNLQLLDGRNTAQVAPRLIARNRLLVSEPLARKMGLAPGRRLSLPTPGGMVQFQVEGIYYDYSTDRGFLLMDRSTYLAHYGDTSLSSLAVYLREGVDAEQAQQEIRSALAGRLIEIFPNRQLRERALRVFDQTFRITYVLEVVALLVAILGMTNTLAVLVLERRAEVGVLRFLGASPSQLGRFLVVEAGVIGVVGITGGLLLGALLSALLIYVINLQSFGWTIQPAPPWGFLLQALILIFGSTLLAGVYPARLATGMDPLRAVRTE